jgi:hypothetical protein
MATDELDQAEIDRLVDELAHPARYPQRKRAVVRAAAESAPLQAPALHAAARDSVTRVGSWTTRNLSMPATRTEPKPSFASTLAGRAEQWRLVQALQTWRSVVPNARQLRQMEWGALSVRVFVTLGVLLSAAMPYWPYSHAWSWGLLFYLCAIELVVITGIWGAKLTWDARMPAAQTVALGTVIWGLGLLVWEAVPRLAYA